MGERLAMHGVPALAGGTVGERYVLPASLAHPTPDTAMGERLATAGKLAVHEGECGGRIARDEGSVRQRIRGTK